jgi:GNAT superfamily N-acetyltransferase
LESFYPPESRHGFSVERLIKDGVAFFVLRVDGAPAGCGGIKLFGRELGELKRMYVRPESRGRKYGECSSITSPITHERTASPCCEDPLSRCYEKSPAEG